MVGRASPDVTVESCLLPPVGHTRLTDYYFPYLYFSPTQHTTYCERELRHMTEYYTHPYE